MMHGQKNIKLSTTLSHVFGFPTKTLYEFLFVPIRATCPANRLRNKV